MSEMAYDMVLRRSCRSRRTIEPLVLPEAPTPADDRLVVLGSEAPSLSVVVPSAGRRPQLEQVLHGLARQRFPCERFEAIVSNPPYVRAEDPHLAGLQHEPMLAIEAGADGLDAIRAVVQGAPQHLLPGGWLLVEHGMGQQQAVRALLEAAGLETASSWPDLAGIPRVAGGKA